MGRNRIRRGVRGVALAAGTLLLGTGSLAAQTFLGRAVDDGNDAPIPTALIRLLDQTGETLAVAAADSAGRYSLVAPEPGVFRIEARRLGYETFRSPLLQALDPDGVYPLDLALARAPLPLRGFTVTAERADRQIHLLTGINPRSMRRAPIRYEEIQRSIEMGRNDLTSLLRWSNTSSMVIYRTQDGPCYTLRGGGCLPVYFNGFHYRQEILDVVPLDMIHSVVIVFPNETVAYPGGAVLLYSEAWIR